MYRVIHSKTKNKYSVIFTNSDLTTYMVNKKDRKIVYFNSSEQAQSAIEGLGCPDFSLYYMKI